MCKHSLPVVLISIIINVLLLSGCKSGAASEVSSLQASDVDLQSSISSETAGSAVSTVNNGNQQKSPTVSAPSQTTASADKTELSPVNEVTADILAVPDTALFETPDLQRKEFKDSSSGKSLPYRLYIPQGYDKSHKYPVLLFLHGAGERGTDNTVSLSNFKKSFRTAGDLLKQAIIVAPQCPESGWWNIDEEYGDEKGWLGAAMRLLNEIKAEYPCDDDRIYVTGLSMGGYATWSLLERYPTVFAAGVPVCGWGNTGAASILKNIPIWIYHGTADPTVSYSSSESMYNSIKSAGGNMIELIPLYGVKHNAWDYSYTDRNMFCWLFSQSRKKAQSHNTDYEYIPIFEVKSPQNESVITDADITDYNFEYINETFCCFAELTDDGVNYLQKAYKNNLGKKFTVYYAGTPIYTFKPQNTPTVNSFFVDECMEQIISFVVNEKN